MDLGAPITSKANVRVKALRASLSGKAREAGDLLGVEGAHLIREAHLAGLSFETVYLREGSEGILDQSGNWRKNLRTSHWAVLSREVFDSAVDTVSPQGIAATWLIHDPVCPEPLPHVLLLEGLQDPGNLGTLIRSADALGVRRLMVTPETVNHWNPKVLRAASGSAFRVPVARLPLEDIVDQLRSDGVRIFAAVACFCSGPEHGVPVLAAPHGVLTGRIANIAAPETNHYKDHPLDTPASQPNTYAASLSYDADFAGRCAIMIGNEGAGLSMKARRLADEQVLIPGSVESLNAATAGSILMYEMMRQNTLRLWARRQGLRV